MVIAAAEGAARRIILVHGTGHGGWCWYRVATLLRAAGHRVDAPDARTSRPRASTRDPSAPRPPSRTTRARYWI
ncbi:hypothetical protein BAE44_0015094 [Dichanthelium oligosanthes]|uniref:AB hydrolase-1 domain-containing protein n=1 Tax=Dichanthelium oligosanthes TaxID=888268 RepID=A0A1E5VFN7_9POAL|nr:hypothetical protein BAE44_0015094 [Dichanthelium oligosanthes]